MASIEVNITELTNDVAPSEQLSCVLGCNGKLTSQFELLRLHPPTKNNEVSPTALDCDCIRSTYSSHCTTQCDCDSFGVQSIMTNECATSLLSHKSPAFGAISPDLDEAYTEYVEFAYPVITDNSTKQSEQVSGNEFPDQTTQDAETNDTPNQGPTQKRRLEASNTDLQKIETLFGTSLEMNAKNLDTTAAYYVMPWPSNYWAHYQDGINFCWSPGNPRASEKYATAFDLDPTSFTETRPRESFQ
ncbi:unnamed protein product [Phytophthora lilii]|uniref:Unnamed protein product n=1 Tax=Phytophthora lilii TaxID=2077276 RepID=A0A9W6U0W3_9STRA|nr:unnamed protein product [Phytophthora lilii]